MRVAPIFSVSDLAAALAYYRGLGFGARQWHGGGYGFVTFDGAEIHLGAEPELDTTGPTVDGLPVCRGRRRARPGLGCGPSRCAAPGGHPMGSARGRARR